MLLDVLWFECIPQVDEVRTANVEVLELEMHLFVQLLLLHGIGNFFVAKPKLVVLVRDLKVLDERLSRGEVLNPVSDGNSLKRTILVRVHCNCFSKQACLDRTLYSVLVEAEISQRFVFSKALKEVLVKKSGNVGFSNNENFDCP